MRSAADCSSLNCHLAVFDRSAARIVAGCSRFVHSKASAVVQYAVGAAGAIAVAVTVAGIRAAVAVTVVSAAVPTAAVGD